MKTKTTNRNHDNDSNACSVEHTDKLLPIPKLPYRQSCLVVVFCSMLCFWRCQFAEFTFDDNSAILNNADVRSETPLWNLFENDFWGTKMQSNLSHKSYRPLTVLTYKLNYFLSGGYEPWSFHVVNLMLHTVNCVLLLRVFSIFFGQLSLPFEEDSKIFSAPRMSLFAAVLFTVHPIHTESIVAAVGRADLLCCIFFNLSLILYTRGGTSVMDRPKDFFLSIICATTAMFCKEQGITAIGVCMAYDVIFGLKLNWQLFKRILTRKMLTGDHLFWSKWLQRFAIMISCVFILMIVRLKIMGSGAPAFQKMDNPASFHPSIIFRILNYNYIYSLNIWLLLSPWWLCFDWAMGCIPVITSFNDPRLIAPLVMFVVLLLMVVKIAVIHDTKTGRFLVMSFALLIIPFMPAMNLFFRVGFVVAERNLYISSIGFCMLVVFGANSLCSCTSGRKMIKLGMVIMIALFIARSIDRTNDWLTEDSLFKSGERVCPLNAKVHYNIGKKSQDSGDFETAVKYYKESIRLSPVYDQPMNNLGNILKDQKKYKEADFYLTMAVNVTPTFAAGWMNLGIVKAEANQKAEAIHCYRQAVLHRRNYPDAYYNWANLYLDHKDHKEALEKFEQAIELKNDHLQAWQNKVTLLGELGASTKLLEDSKRASQIFSRNDHLQFLLGNSLGRIGRFKESIKYLQQCLKLNPNHSSALGSLGVVYHHLKEYKKAEEHYKRSVALNPHDQGTIQNYNKLLKILQKQ